MSTNHPAPPHVRADLWSAIMVALDEARAHQSTAGAFATVLVEAGAKHYGELHSAERVAEMLDELASAAGALAARIEPENLER